MDALPQGLTDAWLHSVATSPIAGAVGMVLLVVTLTVLKAWFPALVPSLGGGGGKAPDPDNDTRPLRAALDHAGDHLEQAADHLRIQCELVRRQAEALERLERTIAVLVAQERRGELPRRPVGGPR